MQLIQDFNNYGQEEISMLKRQVQDQKLILEEVSKRKNKQDRWTMRFLLAFFVLGGVILTLLHVLADRK